MPLKIKPLKKLSMKKFYVLFAMLVCTVAVHSQTIFTYGSNEVSKDEFLRAYNKNSTPVNDKEKSLREYLELYSNFKLKVKAAEELRLDTLPQIKYDIENFRRQVEENYMSDEKGVARLLDEAFYRTQKDLHVAHFSIGIDTTLKPADTLKAYQDIVATYQALNSGDINYKAIAEKNNVRFGDLGFITVFSVPYEYENIIYSLKPGQVSKAYRSKNAWHIFKLLEERKSIGKWKIAQVLFTYPPDAGADIKKAIQTKADSVYLLLKNGADFGLIAKEYSDDKLTYQTGGEMPEFGTGKYDYDFEKEVFKLTKDGDLTQPFTTQFGIHIVKRIGFNPTPAEKENQALQFELKQKILQDPRISSAKEKFAKDIITIIGYKKSASVKDADLFRYADSATKDLSAENTNKFPISNKTIITFKNGSLNGSDWLKFVREFKLNSEQYNGESNAELWKKYTTMSSLDYYKKHLEEYNADFKYQMKEFKEGNMLFEIMERNVWSKAAIDSTGLLNQYNANKSNYKWPESADVLILNCSNEKAANDAMEAIKSGKNWKELAETSNGSIQCDSGRYELSQIAIDTTGKTKAIAGAYSPIVKSMDGTATFIKYLNIYPANQQRSFEEAKGLVINDYQSVLEKKWLEILHKKYPVKINEALVKQMLN
jgi:peptidyl-prolyl cis-trans isomerase SurA